MSEEKSLRLETSCILELLLDIILFTGKWLQCGNQCQRQAPQLDPELAFDDRVEVPTLCSGTCL